MGFFVRKCRHHNSNLYASFSYAFIRINILARYGPDRRVYGQSNQGELGFPSLLALPTVPTLLMVASEQTGQSSIPD